MEIKENALSKLKIQISQIEVQLTNSQILVGTLNDQITQQKGEIQRYILINEFGPVNMKMLSFPQALF